MKKEAITFRIESKKKQILIELANNKNTTMTILMNEAIEDYYLKVTNSKLEDIEPKHEIIKRDLRATRFKS